MELISRDRLIRARAPRSRPAVKVIRSIASALSRWRAEPAPEQRGGTEKTRYHHAAKPNGDPEQQVAAVCRERPQRLI